MTQPASYDRTANELIVDCHRLEKRLADAEAEIAWLKGRPHVGPKCACVSNKYGHCPELVAWAVNLNDKEIWLCERCYKNAKAGAYGPTVKILAEVPVSLIVGVQTLTPRVKG